MDLEAVRTFVAVAETGQFQEAAADLAITQQAASKRVARLEAELDVRLFARTGRGATLTPEGRELLPHARELLAAAQRAIDAVQPGRRVLRVDVIAPRGLTGHLVRDLARARPDLEIEVEAIFRHDDAVAALQTGVIDASFRAVAPPGRPVPPDLCAARVVDEPLDLLVGVDHELALARSVSLGDLKGRRIWMPGAVPGTEWAAYYAELEATVGLEMQTDHLDGSTDALFDVLARCPDVATFVGQRPRLSGSDRLRLRRIPVVDPTPVYPHSLLWRRDDPHPALPALVDHLTAARSTGPLGATWVPRWARPR